MKSTKDESASAQGYGKAGTDEQDVLQEETERTEADFSNREWMRIDANRDRG